MIRFLTNLKAIVKRSRRGSRNSAMQRTLKERSYTVGLKMSNTISNSSEYRVTRLIMSNATELLCITTDYARHLPKYVRDSTDRSTNSKESDWEM